MKRYIYYVLISLLLPLSVVAQTDGYDPVNPPDPNWPDDNTTIYYKVVLEAIPYGSGRFSLNNYSSFKAGETVTVTAQDHNDCYFICWKDVEGNEVTTDRTLQFTMPASDVKYYAIYSYDPAGPGNPELVNRYMLSLKCEPAVAGYFSFKDQKVFEGSQQSLYVYRNSGFKFLCWKDADGIILDEEVGLGLGEIDVLILYGLTFLLAGLVAWVFLWIREKKPYNPFAGTERPKALAACCEEFGQVFYVFAMARNPVVSAPIVASYCIVSVLLGHLFLKEKLKAAQYACIIAVIAGIVIIGFTGD